MVDWAKELDRYEHRCRVFRDEEESGSVTLLLSFMDGRPVRCSITDKVCRVMNLSPKDVDTVATAVKYLWDRLSRENKRFYGDIVITRLYCKGILTEQEESSTVSVKVT